MHQFPNRRISALLLVSSSSSSSFAVDRTLKSYTNAFSSSLKELVFSDLAGKTILLIYFCMNFGYFSHDLSVALFFHLSANFTKMLPIIITTFSRELTFFLSF